MRKLQSAVPIHQSLLKMICVAAPIYIEPSGIKARFTKLHQSTLQSERHQYPDIYIDSIKMMGIGIGPMI